MVAQVSPYRSLLASAIREKSEAEVARLSCEICG